jgi:hypothetical protein
MFWLPDTSVSVTSSTKKYRQRDYGLDTVSGYRYLLHGALSESGARMGKK